MAQNNRLKYYISFEADTKKAKSQIDEMMRSLQQVNAPKNVISELFSGDDLRKARANVAELETMLKNAVNVDTGRLDLSKLNRSLRSSNKTLSNFASSFSQLGEEGRHAFSKITEAVLRGEAPLRRRNSLFDKMAETMRNTVRWQISATALNAFTSSIQNAYRYAEDLNRSLNDIRIVTGQSVEQMDAFAVKANKAARELSVSTKAYADAALIFYQQGLDDNEVLERTNAVMKMSNVTGETASDVSSYMTAIWNNFDDGSKSLEYYGDVITKLGAATAASSEEIAGGLEKFAAVADTVGLSYEYASAALATIIDRTRQSEDVVGTSLRTIFARLSSLSLGETLEDGVDLTKYSKALDTVGVKILDQSGQLKEMDIILDELGAKWGTLNGAQKQALATTVAGVRQYSQLIALMDNYDLFKVNVDLAIDSEGTLTEQSKIFEESWLGAQKRVTAALEGIYDTLLEDKVFIFLTNGLASILELVDWIIDRAGGLPGMLGLAGLAIQKVFGRDIKQVVDDLFYSIRTQMGRTQRDIGALMQNIARQNEYVQGDYDTQSMQSSLYSEQAKWASQILTTHKQITDELRDQLKVQQITNQSYIDAAIVLEQDIEKRRKENSGLKRQLPKTQEYRAETADLKNWSFASELNSLSSSDFKKNLGNAIFGLEDSEIKTELLNKFEKIGDLRNPINKRALEKLANELDILQNPEGGYLDNQEIKASYLASRYGKTDKQKIRTKTFLQNQQEIERREKAALGIQTRLQEAEHLSESAWLSGDAERYRELVDEKRILISQLKEEKEAIQRIKEENQENILTAEELNGQIKEERVSRENLNKLNLEQKESLESMFSTAMSGAFKAMSAWSALSAGIKALGDETLSVEQKFTSFVTSFTMGSMQAASAINEFSKLGTLVKGFEIKEGTFLSKVTDGAKDLKGALIALGPKIAIAAAALFMLYSAFKAIEKTTPEYALEKAKEEAQKASKAASEAAKAYSELKTTLDGFNEKYNAIEDMVVGTIEWRNAVSELNDQLLEVIKKYELLEGTDYYYDEQGMLRLTESGQQKATEQAQRNMAITSNAARLANANVDKVAADNALKEAQQGKELLSWQLGKGGQAPKILDNILKDALEKGTIPTLENLKQTFDELNISASDESLQSFLDKVKNAADAAGQAKTADIAAYSSMISGYTIQNDKNVSDELMPEYIEAQSQRLSEWTEKKQNEYLNMGKWHLDENVAAVGDILGQDVQYNSFKNALTYKGEDGKDVTLSREQVSQLLASRDLEDNYERILSSNHTQATRDAEEAQYGKLYTKEELDNRDNNYRSKKTDSNAVKSELDEKQIETYQEYLEKVVGISETMSKDMAVANMRFNEGMSDLLDNWDEYKTKLNASNRGTAEYVETLDALRNTMSEILNVDSDKITEDFLTNAENMALMEQAYLGNVDAIGELQKKMVDSLIDGVETLDQETLSEFDNLIAQMNLNSDDLKIGMTLDDEAAQQVYGSFVNLMNELLRAGAITTDQVNDILSSINLTPEIEYEEVTGLTKQQAISTGYILGKDGEYQKVTSSTDFTTDTKIYVPKINSKTTKVTGIPQSKLNTENQNKGASNASSRRKDTKKADDEIERYHLIKETIEDLNRELDRLGKEKDRAWGNAHLQYIDREIAKTEEAIDAQKEYLRQIEENYGKDRGALAAYGGQFDENGRLTNYEELMREQIAKYNAAVRSGSETQQEAAEEQYNNFKKALEQYEETADLFESEYEQLLDLQNQYYDKLLERIQYKVEVDIQISEEADKYYDYILDMLEDKAYSAAEAIAYLGKKTEESLKRIASYQEALNSMFEMHGFGDDAYERFANGELSIEELATAGFTSQEIDMLIEYRGALMEENKQLMEMRDQVMSSLTDTFDEYMDTLDKMIDKFDHLNAVTSAYKNIVDIVGKKALGISNDMLKAMDEATVATATNALKASKDRLDAAEAAMADMKAFEADYQDAMAKANAATTEEDKIYWETEAERLSDAMEHIKEESRAAKEAFLGDWEEAHTTAREVFESNVQSAIEKFEDAISGIYGSLDAMKEAYDQNKVLREQYLEEYERIYELNKLNRDITNSIDDIDSIAAKQALRDLQEEINELQQSGAQISKYDLDMLRMRYELRLAEIALEDAQNAKSQVRMSRDNDGNWSYVYTADEGAVADAQQGYEDKMMAMQQSSNDYLNQMSEQWIAAEIEMEQAYQKIWEDRTLSDEERAAAIDRLYEYYGERFNFFNDQITNALGNNKILYEEDWLAWADKNNIQIESNDSFLTNFEDTVLGVTTGFDDVDTLHQELLDAVGRPGEGGYLGDLDEAYTDWQENVSDIMNAAGTSVTDFGDDFAEVAEDTVEDSAEMAEEVENMSETMKDAFEDVVGAVKDWRKEYSDVIAANIKQNSNMINSLADLLDRINKTIDAQIKLNSVTGEGPTSATGGYVGNEIDRNSGSPGETQTEKYWRYGSFKSKDYKVVVDYLHSLALESGDDYDAFWNREYPKIQYYNTGGYTGTWGASGKLAMLHEKELVLNKDDTANFLSAINIVRDIVKVVDMNAAISGMGIGALAAGGIAGAGSTIEQSVTIYADFPNATDHSEIELALANLMNSASQYANRKG